MLTKLIVGRSRIQVHLLEQVVVNLEDHLQFFLQIFRVFFYKVKLELLSEKYKQKKKNATRLNSGEQFGHQCCAIPEAEVWRELPVVELHAWHVFASVKLVFEPLGEPLHIRQSYNFKWALLESGWECIVGLNEENQS